MRRPRRRWSAPPALWAASSAAAARQFARCSRRARWVLAGGDELRRVAWLGLLLSCQLAGLRPGLRLCSTGVTGQPLAPADPWRCHRLCTLVSCRACCLAPHPVQAHITVDQNYPEGVPRKIIIQASWESAGCWGWEPACWPVKQLRGPRIDSLRCSAGRLALVPCSLSWAACIMERPPAASHLASRALTPLCAGWCGCMQARRDDDSGADQWRARQRAGHHPACVRRGACSWGGFRCVLVTAGLGREGSGAQLLCPLTHALLPATHVFLHVPHPCSPVPHTLLAPLPCCSKASVPRT